MSFAIEDHEEASSIATENSDFESFPELITTFTRHYGVRLFNVLLDCFVDELDLPE
jgi:hypothetical protein